MTMPMTITHNGETYFKTGYTGTTLDACKFGPGLKSYEYWHETHGDNIRLHAVSPTQYWID